MVFQIGAAVGPDGRQTHGIPVRFTYWQKITKSIVCAILDQKIFLLIFIGFVQFLCYSSGGLDAGAANSVKGLKRHKINFTGETIS